VRSWSEAECRDGYARAVAATPLGGRPRLTDKPLLDRLVEVTLEVARETGRPIQVHSGFGDPDIDLIAAKLVDRDDLDTDEALGIGRSILADNARALYRIPAEF
jgi:hypothetical protein